MIPNTVGELKRLLDQYPDEMPFDVDVDSAYGIYEMGLDVENRKLTYDGTHCKYVYGNFLVLNVKMDS